MYKKLFLIAFIICTPQLLWSQGGWTQVADMPGLAREQAIAFSIANYGYLGLGENNTAKFNDIWKYNPSNNTWTQIATFPAGRRSSAVSFVVDDKAYITTGTDSANSYRNDLWEYYPTNNEWTQKASFPGTARANAVAFASLTKGYVGTGYDGTNYKNDFWEYNPSNNSWSQIENFPGTARVDAFAFGVENKGYVGTGYDGDYKQDFWEYNASAGEWTQKANFAGEPLCKAAAVSLLGKGYVFCGANPPFKDNTFEYDPNTNSWAEKSNYPNGARRYPAAFSAGDFIYAGTGFTNNGYTNDFWKLDFSYGLQIGDVINPLIIGDSVVISYTIIGTYNQENEFRIEVSDSNGSFSNPVVIGTKRSISSGSIACYLVGNLASGTSYRFRVASTKPACFSANNGVDITLISPWTQKANFGGGPRHSSISFSIGNKGYIGMGWGNYYDMDFWEYDPSTNLWTQKANFDGLWREGAVGFSIGNKGYIGTGYNSSNYYNDFWEYDPATNQWTQKANFGGTARGGAVGFSIGNKGYIGTGQDGLNDMNDFWEYDPTLNQWEQKANFGGVGRVGAVGFSIGTKGYIGTGSYRDDFWEYDQVNDAWTQKSDFGGVRCYGAVGFSIGNKGYIGTGWDGGYKKDFWEYNPATNQWTQKANFGGSARNAAVGFSIGAKGYIGTGLGSNDGDFWEYTPNYVDFLSPILLSPAYNSESVAIAPSYHWKKVDSILSYTLQVSLTNNFDSLIVQQTAIVDTFYISSNPLQYNTQYFWRVASIDTLNNTIWSNVWHFRTVDSVPPSAPNLLSPTNNSSGVSLNPALHWNSISSALAYNLQVSTTEDFSNLIINQIGLAEPFYLTSSLAYSSTYYWRVAATNSTGSSGWSEVWNFTTSLAPSVAPVLISPLNNSIDLPLSNTLAWEQIQNATGYNLEVSLNPYFTQLVASLDNYANTSFEVEGLNYSTTYYWRVRAYNEGGASPWSLVFQFATYNAAPLAPVLAYPLNGEIGVSAQPNFIWYPSLNAMHYTLQVSLNIDFDEENIVYDAANIQTTVHQSSALELNALYYWRVRAVNLAGSSEWSAARSFTTTSTIVAVPPSWYFTSETGNSAQVIVPINANPSLVNRPLLGGDAIGVFYQRNEQLICAGYALWTGQNLNIAVWGDDDQTAIKDGFDVNEEFYFKIWDAQIGEEFLANATYLQGPDNYRVDGFSVLNSLIANPITSFDIFLNQGWNQASSSILPLDPFLPTLCESINSVLLTMKNGTGLAYVPPWDINTIGSWNLLDGYKMYLSDSTILSISGFEINPLDYPLNLTSGWKLIAYLRTNEMEIQTALATISGSFIIVKNNAGDVYAPSFGINTIGNMLPTQGYFIYMSNAADLVYPSNDSRRLAFPSEITAKATRLIPKFNNTGNSASLILELTEFENGCEVAVYNVNDELIGSGAVHNGIAAVTIWGDDEVTANIDGAFNGELLSVKLLNSNGSLNNLSLYNMKDLVSNTELDNLTYKTDAIYTAKAIVQAETELALNINIVPNPASSITTFEFSIENEGKAAIEIYTLNGELIAKIGSNFYAPGVYKLNFDPSSLVNGVYNVVLSSSGKRASSLMIINK